MDDRSAASALALVYNIVRRVLSSDAEVCDVVQDAMVRLPREVDGWSRAEIVAVTGDAVRERTDVVGSECEAPVMEVGFVDRPLDGAAALRQRRETARAARRLGDGERELPALWSLERGGHIGAGDMSHALGQDPYRVATGVSRAKRRFEVARLLERALTATPRCPGLVMTGDHRHGRGPLLWHVQGCERCRLGAYEPVPAEALLSGVPLLPVPAGYAVPVRLDEAEPVLTAVGADRSVRKFV
ncbi:hypothetical protein [Saccharothrix sp.]|uniref:hypothetical protein n=1 Tax=Saccharothrix sp. TaxID=1873460 RepID=UPI002810F99E|nr:hypothetical protein [Saccharothrix sp.]